MTYNALAGLCLYLYLVTFASMLSALVAHGVRITIGVMVRTATWPLALPIIAIITVVRGR